MAKERSISIFRGSAKNLDFTMDPVQNITGWTISFTLATDRNMVTKLLTVAATVTNGAAGTFTVALTSAQTDIAPSEYEWDVWRTDAAVEHPLAFGRFILQPSVRFPQ